MTTIITRLYADEAAAQTVVAALLNEGHRTSYIDVITRHGGGDVAARMGAALVSRAAVAAYLEPVNEGRALVVVRAPFAPIGTALNAIRTVNLYPSIPVGLDDEDTYIREQPKVELSGKILTRHPLFMSNPFRNLPHGHILGSNPIIASRERTSAIRGGAYISTKFWPMKLLSSQKERHSVIRGGFLFSSIFGLPTVIREWGPREIRTIIN
jgi:hypothetical protein